LSKDWRAYAEHILAAAAKLDRIATRGDIAEDDILYDAALRNLQTMAEANQKLPESLKAPYPEIEWRKISAFRNVIAHNYLGDIDPATIAGVITDHVAPLAFVVEKMLALPNK
jgi:uncharacterized protein with HEPN domain